MKESLHINVGYITIVTIISAAQQFKKIKIIIIFMSVAESLEYPILT